MRVISGEAHSQVGSSFAVLTPLRSSLAIAEYHRLEDLLEYLPSVARGFMGHGSGACEREGPTFWLSSYTSLRQGLSLVLEPMLGMYGMIARLIIATTPLVATCGAERFVTLTLQP